MVCPFIDIVSTPPSHTDSMMYVELLTIVAVGVFCACSSPGKRNDHVPWPLMTLMPRPTPSPVLGPVHALVEFLSKIGPWMGWVPGHVAGVPMTAHRWMGPVPVFQPAGLATLKAPMMASVVSHSIW